MCLNAGIPHYVLTSHYDTEREIFVFCNNYKYSEYFIGAYQWYFSLILKNFKWEKKTTTGKATLLLKMLLIWYRARVWVPYLHTPNVWMEDFWSMCLVQQTLGRPFQSTVLLHIRPGGPKGTRIVQTLGQAVKFGTANACLRHMRPKEVEDTSTQEAAGDCEDKTTSSPAARPSVQPQVSLSFKEFSSCLLAIHPLTLGSDVSVPLSELQRLSCLFN